MNARERQIYHQIYPLKLATDVVSALAGAAFFWQHSVALALAVGLLPPIVASVLVLRFANLDRYRDSRIGAYIGRNMTRRVEAARLAGLLPLWGGAWLQREFLIAVGIVWILLCCLWCFRAPSPRDAT
jgi:hypothetical protein